MSKRRDNSIGVGAVFGNLTVLEFDCIGKYGHVMWKCLCSCGSIIVRNGCNLKKGKEKSSCGCARVSPNKTHGMSKTKIYKIWAGMIKRCYYKSHDHYDRYGGRGISVCERWRIFVNFYSDMSGSYKEGLTLERINNNGNYTPKNTKWGTWEEQVNNRSTSRFLTCFGITTTLSRFARLSGISERTLTVELNLGGLQKKPFLRP